MLLILSPAKSLNSEKQEITNTFTLPCFLKESSELITICKKFSPNEIEALMGISNSLATLNYNRFKSWKKPFTQENAKQAILTFNGEVYNGLKAYELNEEDLLFAQNNVRILSGLYGCLKPLDLIQPYRLEMGTKLENKKGTTLYDFWGNLIQQDLEKELKNHAEKVLVNLASNEYAKAVKLNQFKHPVITPLFKELKDGEFKTITIYAKKARGLMTRFLIDKRINKAEDLKTFDYEGYQFNSHLSTENEWTFVR